MSNSLIEPIPLYPLRFVPIYKDYLWGGNKFREMFHRTVPDSMPIVAESWEVADHPNGRSVIANGSLQGRTLNELVRARPDDLFGAKNRTSSSLPKNFPLILKYLDAEQFLSVQIHPDDKLAAAMMIPDQGKTEAWIVVNAQPGSFMYVGTERRYTPKELDEAIWNESLEKCLHKVSVRVGDCFYIKPGTLHALGPGIMVAEIQTASDVTFRFFDWNRLDKDGKPRALKIEEGLRALDRQNGPIRPQVPSPTEHPFCLKLVADPHFTMNHWTVPESFSWKSDGRCHIWTVLEGEVAMENEELKLGDSILLPAVCSTVDFQPRGHQAVLLDCVVNEV